MNKALLIIIHIDPIFIRLLHYFLCTYTVNCNKVNFAVVVIGVFVIITHLTHFSDLCTAFGSEMLPLVDKETMNQLLTKGRRSKTSKTKTLAQWATREIRKLKNASSW